MWCEQYRIYLVAHGLPQDHRPDHKYIDWALKMTSEFARKEWKGVGSATRDEYMIWLKNKVGEEMGK